MCGCGCVCVGVCILYGQNDPRESQNEAQCSKMPQD